MVRRALFESSMVPVSLEDSQHDDGVDLDMLGRVAPIERQFNAYALVCITPEKLGLESKQSPSPWLELSS